MRQLLLSLILSGTLAGNAQADITILNAYPCAEWHQDRKAGGAYKSIANAWLIGLMNGYAITTQRNFWESLEIEQVMFWMDRYCDNNPFENTYSGSVKLMEQRYGKYWYEPE